MAWTEKLYQRKLRRPLDDATRQAISQAFVERRHQIPMHSELTWHDSLPELTISSKWIKFVVNFHKDDLVVLAELSWAAKMFATDENRRTAVQFIDNLVKDLDL